MIYKFATAWDKPIQSIIWNKANLNFCVSVLIRLNIIHDGADVYLLPQFGTFLSPPLHLKWFNRNV